MSMLAAAALSAGAGLLGGRKSRKGADEAAEAAQRATAMGVGELQKSIDMLDRFQPAIDNFAQMGQEGFDKYQRMLGPLEDSMNDYYMNLNPEEIANQGNQVAQQQYQNSMKQVNEQLAAQGIQNSGMNAQMGMQYGNQMAQTKAQNILQSDDQVAQQQAGWTGQMQNQSNNAFNQYAAGMNAQQNQSNAYQNAYNNMANLYSGQAAQNNQLAQSGYNTANQQLQSGLTLGAFLGEKANWGQKPAAKPAAKAIGATV